jgi:hypothetical protein
MTLSESGQVSGVEVVRLRLRLISIRFRGMQRCEECAVTVSAMAPGGQTRTTLIQAMKYCC